MMDFFISGAEPSDSTTVMLISAYYRHILSDNSVLFQALNKEPMKKSSSLDC
jgi:hypothetical protein